MRGGRFHVSWALGTIATPSGRSEGAPARGAAAASLWTSRYGNAASNPVADPRARIGPARSGRSRVHIGAAVISVNGADETRRPDRSPQPLFAFLQGQEERLLPARPYRLPVTRTSMRERPLRLTCKPPHPQPSPGTTQVTGHARLFFCGAGDTTATQCNPAVNTPSPCACRSSTTVLCIDRRVGDERERRALSVKMCNKKARPARSGERHSRESREPSKIVAILC